jgi:rubrerythrin
MMSNIPIDLANIPGGLKNRELLRAAIISELDAINLYEQMAAVTDDKDLRAVFMDVAKEEKTHMGEFQTMLLRLDREQKSELAHGKKEVEELTE